ncbi:methyltransferase domain-containing protein [Pseudoalteromonas tetraodonis]|jgi:ubiquinone/menaquinone biosynthesis C-methylase UbiE|uniref:class I SAM-dependent methyltransferase n=1 Tax=Pseudoalteromonas tetraodonis TaxID=43659 RepID=UPI001BDE2FF3|nr:class I SAM-dependent methyltransferase [Pseudoalteromonas tetraodonis]MBT2151005.1 methyltransferase domain-containing protein [Pseudoalteromonas tetraodonis]
MHWDHYWNFTSALSSFGDAELEFGYPDEILEFWSDLVLSEKNCNYLDLATGKGALAIWLQNRVDNLGLCGKVYGCDLASINKDKITSKNPSINESIKKVSFDFNTPLEKLPYPDNTFDVIVSQFGFEYSDWSNSLPEAIRVLTENGKISLMLHTKESVITKDCRAGIKVLKWLIEERLFEDLTSVISFKSNNQSFKYKESNTNLINKIKAYPIVSQDEQVWYNDIISKISKIMININTNSLHHLESLKDSVFQQITRLEDQVSVALSKAEIIDNIKKVGINLSVLEVKEFYVEDSLFSLVLNIEV